MAARRRRGAADPAREVPRRAVRPPVRRPGEGRRPGQLRDARRPRRGARRRRASRWCCSRTTAAPLPLDLRHAKSTAVIGPLGDDKHDMLGPWWGQGKDEDAVSVFDGIKAQNPNTTLHAGLHDRGQGPAGQHARGRVRHRRRLRRPRWPRRKAADQVVLALGESRGQSGEAAARSDIDLPGMQQELIDADHGDRQAVRRRAVQRPPADALEGRRRPRRRSSRPGSRASRPATPSPTCCSARSTRAASCRSPSRARSARSPIYYNHEPTGRPCDVDVEVQLALPRPAVVRPALPVRLRAELHDVRRLQPAPEHAQRVQERQRVTAIVDVTNTGRPRRRRRRAALHPRPGREHLAAGAPPARLPAGDAGDPGQKQTVTFTLDKSDFGFYDNRGQVRRRAGQIDVYAGDSSTADLKQSFTVRGF